jgi:hypothetical protein
VTVELEPALVEGFMNYMTDKHAPEILATGCFRSIRLDRAGPTTFRGTYQAATPQDLERYLRDHTAAFRADFVAHFPVGAVVTRITWTEVAAWE